jgi:sRNA-binding carbon storage regulator CsrA
MALVLKAKDGDSISFGERSMVHVIEVKGSYVRLAFIAPSSMRIQLYKSKQQTKPKGVNDEME